MRARWKIAVDVGGTFTDGVAMSPDGAAHRCKVLSDGRARGDALPAPIAAAHRLTGTPPGAALPPMELRVGTTRGTNALLEGRTSRVLMVLPEGLADILEIGDQRRPDLFAHHPVRVRPPLHAIVTTGARRDAAGACVRPLDAEELERVRGAVVQAVGREGIESIGIALLHADVEPEDERRLADCLARTTGLPVVASHEMGRVAGFLERANATHADALLAGPIRGFVREVQCHLAPGSSLQLVGSAGGLADAASFRPKDALLSGPAGGARGALAEAIRHGFGPALAFDMGGTSTDITRLESTVPTAFVTTVAGVSVASPCVDVESIAAGAGSIVRCIAGAIRIGPESAGSDPGPACFGRGGPLTLTDLNLLAGRLRGVPMPLDEAAARVAMERELERFAAARGPVPAGRFVDACLALAEERMAQAIRRHAIRRGHAPEAHVLIAFGGAGPLHACGVAERLGIGTLHVAADAGLLSAVGIAASAEERLAQRSIRLPLVGSIDWDAMLGEVEEEATSGAEWEVDRTLVCMRLMGQESALVIECPGTLPRDGVERLLGERFAEEHRRVFGGPPSAARGVEVESIRVLAQRGSGFVLQPQSQPVRGSIAGPAVLNRMDCTVWVGPGWEADEGADGSVSLRHVGLRGARLDGSPLSEEVLASRIAGIAEEMGEMLRRTAVSVNVKERLDFSCSVLDAKGALVANAPHLPVHLGSMGLCVREAAKVLCPGRGQAIAVNHPAHGGSHLPDITVITPVDLPVGGAWQRIAYVASRAHHAELGGTRPGSMPPDATRLDEEAVVIPPTLIRDGGETDVTAVERLLRSSSLPSRQPEENLQDLLSQVAANELGAAAVRALAGEIGIDGIGDAFEMIRAGARRRAAAAIASLPADTLGAEERLDDGSALRVLLTRRKGALTVDFSGSAPIHPRSLNAPAAVVRSVVMYVLRLVAGRVCPQEAAGMVLNEGFLDDVSILGLGGMLGPAVPPTEAWPAVGAGNTETSQRLTDLLLKACGIAACSQGTMNNLLFGNRRFGFYETIGGGAGATSDGAGLSGVHTHMTNTRITDPEILERRMPVRLERFELRRGSGGAGLHAGGDGIVRTIRFLEPVELSLLAQHRTEGPYGAAGGCPGSTGEQRILRGDGTTEPLGGMAAATLSAGDAIEVCTPGGGGWGPGDGASPRG